MIARARRLPSTPWVPPPADVPAGFRVIASLGRGRRMETWDAWDEERQTRVVLKTVRADRRDEPGLVQEALREGRIATELSHPHLVRGFGWWEEPPALALESVRGATLAAVVEEGPLEAPDVAELGLQLSSALGYLHRHDWLHLDVKPSNVVVDHGRAVLIDLSLAARPGDGRRGAGTPGYLAPEQARGRGLGPASDVFGLGVTLVECLSGLGPFGDEATWDTRRRWPILDRPMPTVPAGLDAVPAALRDVLAACLDLDPAARPRLADLREALVPVALSAPDAP
jgi:serine/threonine protein kinase